jgi:hypothetical protein
MTSPAGQGGNSGTGRQQSETTAIYCSSCGRPADGAIRRGPDAFCSPEHAEEFAREVAAARAPGEDRR